MKTPLLVFSASTVVLMFMHVSTTCKRCLSVKTWPTLGHLRYLLGSYTILHIQCYSINTTIGEKNLYSINLFLSENFHEKVLNVFST